MMRSFRLCKGYCRGPELCPRYCARVVKNVKIGPSPKWMQRCLASNGIRPINNLVDITNYVMEEFGQPMHAYDLDTIANREIIVRRAGKDEKFVTLDGQERTMDENVLMICDRRKSGRHRWYHGRRELHDHRRCKTVLFEVHALMEPASVFLPRESAFVQMHPVNLRKALTRATHRLPSTVHAS